MEMKIKSLKIGSFYELGKLCEQFLEMSKSCTRQVNKYEKQDTGIWVNGRNMELYIGTGWADSEYTRNARSSTAKTIQRLLD